MSSFSLRKAIIGTPLLLAAFLFGFYIYNQSYDLIRGPVLSITNPENGSLLAGSLVVIEGEAENLSHLTLNGQQIFTDTSGRFREQLLLGKGYTIITLIARDRFNRVISKELKLVRK